MVELLTKLAIYKDAKNDTEEALIIAKTNKNMSLQIYPNKKDLVLYQFIISSRKFLRLSLFAKFSMG